MVNSIDDPANPNEPLDPAAPARADDLADEARNAKSIVEQRASLVELEKRLEKIAYMVSVAQI